ncbi:MAG: tRNA epoxyqueuosine(34) reductase QueG [Sphingobacteriia bacterium]|nr:MAG: tRNA epoxyqueuosine(34) reductase QueG [Sphingobacteriia bacterium]
MTDLDKKAKWVKDRAQQLGFDYCGIAKAEALPEEARKLEAWLNKGYQGSMQYMENHFDLRTDPSLLVPGAKSVITLLKNYFPNTSSTYPLQADQPKVSAYAWGKDYHEVIRADLQQFLFDLRQTWGEINGRGFVDSAPVLERAWAVKSGLGWVGKNGNLITKQQGSFFFIATLITDWALPPDPPFAKDFCGSCTRCIDACPTDAILPDKTIQGNQCISYFTIELKAALIPETQSGKFENWLFGCDTCQDVCPWNRFSKPHQEPAFSPLPGLLNMQTREWENMTEENFKKIFRDSPLKRTKFAGIQRNLRFLKTSPHDSVDNSG